MYRKTNFWCNHTAFAMFSKRAPGTHDDDDFAGRLSCLQSEVVFAPRYSRIHLFADFFFPTYLFFGAQRNLSLSLDLGQNKSYLGHHLVEFGCQGTMLNCVDKSWALPPFVSIANYRLFFFNGAVKGPKNGHVIFEDDLYRLAQGGTTGSPRAYGWLRTKCVVRCQQ